MQFIHSLAPAYAEIFLLCALCAILLIDLFLTDEQRGLTYVLSLLTLLGCFLITAFADPVNDVEPFSDMLVTDPLASVQKLCIYVSVAVVLVYSQTYIRARSMLRDEFFVFALFATLGMLVMVSGASMLTLYLGLELLSLSLYAMIALQRDSTQATEAAMKYFVLGALASGMLLYGMSMLYGATGTLDLDVMSEVISGGEADMTILAFALVFIVAGLGFKLSAVPFHMWVPDVYQGAPTAVTLLVAGAPKLAAFAITIRLLVEGLINVATDWQQMLLILAVASMTLGNLAAIAQTNLKRMLAYSGIAQLGFMLLGFVPSVVSGNTVSAGNGYGSALFYVLTYVLTTLGTFGLIMVLSRPGFESEQVSDLAGLNKRSPMLAGAMAVFMFSLAGIPPTVGFYAKLAVLQALITTNSPLLMQISILAVVLSLVGAFYYLRVIKVMYFDSPITATSVTARKDVRVVLSINGAMVLILGLMPGGLMGLCASAIVQSLGT